VHAHAYCLREARMNLSSHARDARARALSAPRDNLRQISWAALLTLAACGSGSSEDASVQPVSGGALSPTTATAAGGRAGSVAPQPSTADGGQAAAAPAMTNTSTQPTKAPAGGAGSPAAASGGAGAPAATGGSGRSPSRRSVCPTGRRRRRRQHARSHERQHELRPRLPHTAE
jgi:hypothetical protein